MPQTVERLFRKLKKIEHVTLAGTAPSTARLWTGRPITAGAGGLISFLNFQEILDIGASFKGGGFAETKVESQG